MRLLSSVAVLGSVLAFHTDRTVHPLAEKRYLVSPHQPQNIFPPNGPQFPTKPPVANSTYDYIVVGSGPGGAPVAARLALAGHSVLLIDAGEDHGMERQVQVPALHVLSSEYDPIRWDYFVNHYTDETQARRDSKMTYLTSEGDWYSGLTPPSGAKRLGVLYPRVGALGGCSQHNALVTILPNNNDWENIAKLTGDKTWAASNMRKYFQKLESCRYLPNSVTGHGFGGWLQTQVTPLTLVAQDLKIASLVVAAATAMGKGLLGGLVTTVTGLAQVLLQDINNDYPNRDAGEALYQIPLSMKTPEYARSSPRDWVVDIASATNPDGSKKYRLDIALNTLVTKVNFDTRGRRPKATGVDYLFGKSLYRADPRAAPSGGGGGVPGTVHAAREVIVSGGAFNTPQLLKLSGIGPAAELARFGVPVVRDAPGVGGNLQDRYEVGVVGRAPTDFSLLAPCTFLNGSSDPCYDQWATAPGPAKGAYTTNGIAFGFFHHSSQAARGGGAAQDPDLFLGGVPAFFGGYFPGYAQNAVRDRSVWTWLTLKAHSRNNAGTVNLTSADPRDAPAIQFRSFDEGVGGAQDLQAVYEGVQYSLKAFDSVVPLDGRFERVWPPKEVRSEAQLKQFIKDEAWGHHASCTCPIGADSDPMAVLDGNFRVRGVDGLRVVDASVFPKIPGTYIVLPIYMISEKAADVILADAGR